jgi:hypothetical protein
MIRVGKALGALSCLATLVLSPCWSAASADPDPGAGGATNVRDWSLKLPEDDKVAFSGALDHEGASVGSHSMLYPAPNAVGFIAAVITHGVIVESQKSRQRKQAQESADRVLDPYRSILGTVSYRELARAWADTTLPGSSRKLIGAAESPGSGEWLVRVAPLFVMAQDRRTLSIDALVSINAPGATGDAAYQSRIHVISAPAESEDPAGVWTADEGKKLKEVSTWLFSESLNIAMRMMFDATGKNDQPFRTIRYLEGTAEKMERAQLISEHCGRVLIKTLRGALMSVPVKPATPPGGSAEMACGNG